MTVVWTAEMEEATRVPGDSPARVSLPGEGGTVVLLPADDYAWVRGLVTGVPDVPHVRHPVSGREYALFPLGAYERVKPLFEEDPITIEEQKAALRAAGLRAGWNDPIWDDFDNEPHAPA